jgi:hypothetical protein
MKLLEKVGYTGRVYLVIDNEDKTGDEYRKVYGEDRVICFDKRKAAEWVDDMNNFNDLRAVVYARNVCFQVAKDLGCKYFMQLDDDYNSFSYRYRSDFSYVHTQINKTFEEMLDVLINFLEKTPALSVAISQGGDHIGGQAKTLSLKRKAMNTFVCSVERPFEFKGGTNEDVNAYVTESRKGNIFFTVMQAMVNQVQTQSSSGGLTERYLDEGTYVKSFYSVMIEPSCVRVGELVDHNSPHPRIHHDINWENTAVRIIHEKHKKK